VPAAVTGERCSFISWIVQPARPSAAEPACWPRRQRGRYRPSQRPTSRGEQEPRARVGVEHDLDRHPLHDLGEVPRRVVRRQQREGAAGARRPAFHTPGQGEIGKRVHGDGRRIALPDVGHLGLLEIGGDPDVRQRHHRDHLRADIDELTDAHLTLPDQPVGRRHDSRVLEIVAGKLHLRLRRLDLRGKLLFLDVEARQLSLLLIELRIVELQLGRSALLVGFGLFEELLRSGELAQHEIALALRLERVAIEVCGRRRNGRIRLTDQ
jgi:hypothetical protein